MINYHMREKRDMVAKNERVQRQNGYAEEMRKGRVKKSYSASHPPYEGTSLSPENIRRKLSGKVEKHVEI